MRLTVLYIYFHFFSFLFLDCEMKKEIKKNSKKPSNGFCCTWYQAGVAIEYRKRKRLLQSTPYIALHWASYQAYGNVKSLRTRLPRHPKRAPITGLFLYPFWVGRYRSFGSVSNIEQWSQDPPWSMTVDRSIL